MGGSLAHLLYQTNWKGMFFRALSMLTFCCNCIFTHCLSNAVLLLFCFGVWVGRVNPIPFVLDYWIFIYLQSLLTWTNGQKCFPCSSNFELTKMYSLKLPQSVAKQDTNVYLCRFPLLDGTLIFHCLMFIKSPSLGRWNTDIH